MIKIKKTILITISLLFTIMIVGCSNNTSKEISDDKNELLENFFTKMYSFNYDNTDTKQIFEDIKPFLTSDSTISEKEIKDLVTDPATSENVSIEYSSFSIDKQSNKKIDDKNVDSNLVYIDVVVTPNDKNNEYTKKQEITINLKQENNKLKVYNVEYLADNDLFKN